MARTNWKQALSRLPQTTAMRPCQTDTDPTENAIATAPERHSDSDMGEKLTGTRNGDQDLVQMTVGCNGCTKRQLRCVPNPKKPTSPCAECRRRKQRCDGPHRQIFTSRATAQSQARDNGAVATPPILSTNAPAAIAGAPPQHIELAPTNPDPIATSVSRSALPPDFQIQELHLRIHRLETMVHELVKSNGTLTQNVSSLVTLMAPLAPLNLNSRLTELEDSHRTLWDKTDALEDIDYAQHTAYLT
ncbi:hypothetical protein R3P38DRAFT_2816046 [Favolaschia claudopus]|uniref:Zn(2)-C6 fungal-type domain-containing protein n=1 Tax=Favolaschia claudopus TaxID=2862362 RepID=A0AAV9YZT4_9AGAR